MPRAVQLTKFGKFEEVLVVNEVPKPEPGPGQVLIKMQLRPVVRTNPADIFSIMGIYPGFRPEKFPATPGLEGMGVVESVGSGVKKVSSGQRVVPLLLNYVKQGNGSWQDYLVVDEKDVVIMPENISDETAAQFVVNPYTVLGMLRKLNVPQGEYLAQNAAGSTLGRMMIQVCKARGIKTVNVVRRSAQIPELQALGADAVVSSEGKKPHEVAEAIRAAAGGKHVYGAVDAVSGDASLALSMAVRDGGYIYLYGIMEGTVSHIDAPAALFRGIVFTGYWVTAEMAKASSEELDAWTGEALELMGKGLMKPYTGERYPLEKVKEAVAKSQQPGRGGKVLLG
ncbi:hypothetical protein HK104_008476 [Borealophlyctis nickersoniae]|nr:hypothetical protein HK104_008476 [Borealophlyctis nickersoniae]